MAEVPVLLETPTPSIPEIVSCVRYGFRSRRTLPQEYRAEQLRALWRMIEENGEKLFQALWEDLHKSQQEVIMIELNPVLVDINLALNNLHKWMSPEYVTKDLVNKFNTAYIQQEPYGTVLIIAPWNYPLLISLQPLVGAIAAGNACVLKLSEVAVATSNVLADLITKYLDNECYAVVTGGVEVGQELLKQKFDYIFYTGGGTVGRIVMKKAAEHLTPVTLELGGKSPCIVADDANIDVAGQRIMWGKCINAGQSCIAPDYILCTPATQERLVEACKTAIRRFFGENPKSSKDFGRIVSGRHYQHVSGLLTSAREKVVFGGDTDDDECYISPTLLTNVTGEDDIMKEEIFGPILPFVTVESIDKAIEFVNSREKPLALYIFTESKHTLQLITQNTSTGAVTHNDTFLHASAPTLPFGGVGHSGFGAYHGKFTFDTFSHRKPVLSTATSGYLEGVNNIRYPPYSQEKLSDIQRLQAPSQGRGLWPSRLFRLLHLVTLSATGYPPHQQADREE